jgi:hypothetical protein
MSGAGSINPMILTKEAAVREASQIIQAVIDRQIDAITKDPTAAKDARSVLRSVGRAMTAFRREMKARVPGAEERYLDAARALLYEYERTVDA